MSNRAKRWIERVRTSLRHWARNVPSDGNPTIVDAVTPDAVRGLVTSPNTRVQDYFLTSWPSLCDRSFVAISSAQAELSVFRDTVQGDVRIATLELFLHTALNALICSLHHFLSGFPIASGHMMRHYIEAVSMSVLCANPDGSDWKEFTARRSTYPVYKAPKKLEKRKVVKPLQKIFQFDPGAWSKMLALKKNYDSYSHASGLALAYQIPLDKDGLYYLGGDFDDAKASAYEKELRRIATAAESLGHLIGVLTDVIRRQQQA